MSTLLRVNPFLSKKPLRQTLILSSKSLFKTIESSFQFKNIVGILMVLKTAWLIDAYFFIYKVIEESILNVHLIQFKIQATCKLQKETNHFKTDYGSICLLIVNPLS